MACAGGVSASHNTTPEQMKDIQDRPRQLPHQHRHHGQRQETITSNTYCKETKWKVTISRFSTFKEAKDCTCLLILWGMSSATLPKLKLIPSSSLFPSLYSSPKVKPRMKDLLLRSWYVKKNCIFNVTIQTSLIAHSTSSTHTHPHPTMLNETMIIADMSMMFACYFLKCNSLYHLSFPHSSLII